MFKLGDKIKVLSSDSNYPFYIGEISEIDEDDVISFRYYETVRGIKFTFYSSLTKFERDKIMLISNKEYLLYLLQLNYLEDGS